MRPQSSKAKGRRLQTTVANALIEAFELPPDDVRSTSMGAAGEDIQLSARARDMIPFSFECKNVEKLNFWSAFDQCKVNAADHMPALVAKKNRSDTLVVIRFSDFIELLRMSHRGRTQTETLLRARRTPSHPCGTMRCSSMLRQIADLVAAKEDPIISTTESYITNTDAHVQQEAEASLSDSAPGHTE
jgi:hypothetical protein